MSAAHPAPGFPSGDESRAAALLELPGRLLRADSGVAFVYEVLEVVAEVAGVDDAILVVDETAVGRQVFRLGRRPLGTGPGGVGSSEARALLGSAPGLYTTTPGAVDAATAAYVTDLARAALRLDVLDHDAGHDPLTGLRNRRSYERCLSDAVARGRRYGWRFALALVDLDDFKAINDRFGHAVGDDALRVIGAEIRAALRRGDVAARLGGDEFALIIANAEAPEDLDPLIHRLRPKLELALPQVGVRFSAGIACFPDDGDDPAQLQAVADRRLYAEKAAT